jgi:hypothetical protein
MDTVTSELVTELVSELKALRKARGLALGTPSAHRRVGSAPC